MLAAGILAGVSGAMSIGQAVVGYFNGERARKETLAAIDSMKAIAYQKQQYAFSLDEQWKELYGDVAAQNAEYFSNLTADKLKQQYQMAGDAAIGQVYKNLTNTQNSIKEFMNRSNMGNSSQALSALLQANNNALQQNASIALETEFKKLGADAEVANQKLQYVQTGENLRSQGVQANLNAYDSLMQAEQLKVGARQQEWSNYSNMVNAGISGIGNTLTSFSAGLIQGEFAQKAAETTADAMKYQANQNYRATTDAAYIQSGQGSIVKPNIEPTKTVNPSPNMSNTQKKTEVFYNMNDTSDGYKLINDNMALLEKAGLGGAPSETQLDYIYKNKGYN